MTETNTVQNKQSGCGQGTIPTSTVQPYTHCVSHSPTVNATCTWKWRTSSILSWFGIDCIIHNNIHAVRDGGMLGESATTNSNLVSQLCRHSLLTTLRMPKLWILRHDRWWTNIQSVGGNSSTAASQRKAEEWQLIEGWRRKLIIDADEDKDPEGQFCNFSSPVSTGVRLSLSASFDRVMSIADGVGFWSELVELAVADFWPELMELDL